MLFFESGRCAGTDELLSHDPAACTRDRTDHLEEQPEATRRSDEKGERSESERINVSLYRKNEILVEFESDRTG